MALKKYEKNIEKIAISLVNNLHSSATENMISSLICAAFNESLEFREQVLFNVARFNKNLLASNFTAQANDSIPQALRGKEKRDGNSVNSRYQRPDILIYKHKEEGLWDKVYESKRRDHEIIERMHALFIEMKRKYVSPKDLIKYQRFLKKIGRYKNLKFMMIVYLAESEIDRIKTRYKYKYEKILHDLFCDENIIVINYEKIAECLVESGSLNSNRYPSSLLCYHYLKTLIDPSKLSYWEYVCDMYSRPEYGIDYIREDVLDKLLTQAIRAGFIYRYPTFKQWDQITGLRFIGGSERNKITPIKDGQSDFVNVEYLNLKKSFLKIKLDSASDISNKIAKVFKIAKSAI